MRSFVFGSAMGCVSLIALMSCTTPEAPVAPSVKQQEDKGGDTSKNDNPQGAKQ